MTILGNLFRRNTSKESFKAGMPSRRYHHLDPRFKNGAAKDMNVNGSGVPQEFIVGPPVGELWVVDYITLVILDAGDMLPGSFGSIAGPLANGVELFSKMTDVERIGTTLNDNLDVLQCFAGGRPGGVSPVGSADAGFLNSVDYISGQMSFSGGEFLLFGDEGDHLGFRINDDLLNIGEMRASMHARVLLL